jgi:hypothetical protein
MGKQKVKSNQQAKQKLIEKSAEEKATPVIECSTDGFVQGPDLLYALRVVAGTEWEAPLYALVEYLTGLRDSLLAGENKI